MIMCEVPEAIGTKKSIKRKKMNVTFYPLIYIRFLLIHKKV